MRGVLLILIAALPGCHAAAIVGAALDHGRYDSAALEKKIGKRAVRTFGCVDVGFAVERRETGDVVDVHVGNRCERSEPLDLGRMIVRATDSRGNEVDAALRDPKGEVRLLHIGAAEHGRERFRLDTQRWPARLCFDVNAVAPSVRRTTDPVCFENHDDGWRLDV